MSQPTLESALHVANHSTAQGPQVLYADYARQLQQSGTVLIPSNVLFDDDEIARLDELLTDLPEEAVHTGDAGDKHDIYVRRVMVDKPGEFPTLTGSRAAGEIVALLDDDKRRQILAALCGWTEDRSIRRCQVNRMVAGSFIGSHVDEESNPDYEVSAVIQFGRGFEGGEFVVHPDEALEQIFVPTHGSVIITSCKFRHEVRPVLANERRSLVYFYSHYRGPNRRRL